MTTPILLHDPTSEPSRAVHWFCLEAGIPVRTSYIWLTRNDHLKPAFVAINPRHQVPALADGDFHLSEATAIMRYLAEKHGCSGRWLGETLRERARVDQLLSWYHTNLRLKVTLDYFLPALLLPAYVGAPRPDADALLALREGFAETLGQFDALLARGDFLLGSRVTAPDLLCAAELSALDIDGDRETYLSNYNNIWRWLTRMRELPGFALSHRAWHAVVPLVRDRLAGRAEAGADPSWVADHCERVER